MEEDLIIRMEVLQLLEKKYGIEIKDEEVENLVMMQDLINLIKEKQGLPVTYNTEY